MNDHKKMREIIQIEDFQLENGLKVIYAPRHYLPITTIIIGYRVGGSATWKKRTGIAHFLEHMMFKGTKKFPKGEIDSITQKLGGHNNAYTTPDYTCYYFMFATEYWEKALEIEADRMKNCVWTMEDFLSEKQVIMEELSTSLDNPIEVLDQEVEAVAYQEHPYRNPIIGWREDIENLTLTELQDFYKAYYSPNNAAIVVVGDVSKESVIEKTKHYFGKIPQKVLPVQKYYGKIPPATTKKIRLVNDVEVARFEMLFPGCQVGSDDDYILDIIHTILSSGKTSRLYRRLVIEEQILQVIFSVNDSRKDTGVFRIIGEVHPGVFEETVENVILEELEKLKKTLIGSYELAKAKNIIIADFIVQHETNYDLAEKIIQFEMFSSYEEIHSIINKIENVTKQDILRVCNKYFCKEKILTGWSVPKNNKKVSNHIKKSTKKVTLRGMKVPKNNQPIEMCKPKHDSNVFTKKIHEKVFANGLTVLFMENHNLPNFAMNIHVKGGYLYEKPEKAGVAHLMGRLLSEGTKKYNTYKMSCTCEFLGAWISTSSTFLEAKGFTRDFSHLLDMATDIILQPVFDKEILKNQKRKVLTSFMSLKDNCSYRARQEFMKIIYGNHPYGRSTTGTKDTVTKITRKDLIDLHKRYYCPNNMVISVVGDMEKEEVFTTIEKYLGKWQSKKTIFQDLPTLKMNNKPKQKLVSMEKQQINVYWGHLGIQRNNADYYKLLVLDHILGMGAGFTDRLSKRVRDEMGLVYNIWASIASSASVEPGSFCTFFATDPKNYSKAIKVIKEEITSLQQGNISDEEIENAKAYLIGSFVFSFETNASLADYLISAYRLGLGYDFVHKFKDIISNISKADVVEAAQKYIHPEKAISVVAGAVKFIE